MKLLKKIKEHFLASLLLVVIMIYIVNAIARGNVMVCVDNSIILAMTWFEEHSTVCSAIVSILALALSIISTILSFQRENEEQKRFDCRYKELQRQYEERLKEESKRREEDKDEAEKRNQYIEKPYLVFKKSIVAPDLVSGGEFVCMKFLNKGRDSAYKIKPDLKLKACYTKNGKIYEWVRDVPIEDPIAMRGEEIEVRWKVECEEGRNSWFFGNWGFSTDFSIKYEDASGRNYKQRYTVIIEGERSSHITNYSEPELIPLKI